MEDMTLDEKKEWIINSYRESFDKEMAYRKVELTTEERSRLEDDAEFQFRLNYFLIMERENLIRKLRNFSVSENEQVAFKATIELGKILYPELFENLKESPVNVNVNVLSKEEEERIGREYGILLGGKKDIFVKRQ